MSFNIAMTGLSAVNEQLNTISNNIANAGTTGFKSSRTEFGSIYADSQAMGVEVLATTQSISQGGSLVTTGRSLDLAISGGGFFVTRGSNGDVSYTRAGVFGADKDNYIVSASGQKLQGYPVDAAGNLQVGAMGDLQLQNANLPARATDSLKFVMNLDSNQSVPTAAPFDPADVNSYNSTYTTKVFDSQGKEHTLTQYFVKTADNSWEAHYYADGAAVAGPQALTFGTNGSLTAPVGPVAVGFPLPGVDPMNIAIDYSNSSQYGSDFVVTNNRASGYAAGEQTGLSVEKDGMVYANYSNGQRMLQGQVALANFANAGGLKNVSGTAWVETAESGAALIGVPGVGPFGALVAGSLENSNVDLTQQLVGLMEGQRNYQANTKVLTTNKELTQVLFGAI
ncbi:flagellar hook protein FlgE [Ectopseudomonas guguanensis]|jgi:flagellar hook protein FlgE|uniref:flagellar hook protein FlgE n=1 Tax=Ectopseudomonas guguanensis TaxID=1198456 RepID=UPI0012D63C7E|nr:MULTISPECIES: flagellar hook protein FlgE [Pseudomonas]MPT20211.1 flagellar basal body protein FlaE [Pseudomonas sp.]WJH54786.1 flagellar basal body protein FlaE [Pseudomonas guguanensis]